MRALNQDAACQARADARKISGLFQMNSRRCVAAFRSSAAILNRFVTTQAAVLIPTAAHVIATGILSAEQDPKVDSASVRKVRRFGRATVVHQAVYMTAAM